uniref:cell wall-binding repeat-containing protein n=1 Tax=Miniphocaeibacter massiliensis TaxID=2041841 RepID=UPI00101AD12C
EEEREKGHTAVDNSTTEEEVTTAKDTAIEEINKVTPKTIEEELQEAKDKAKEEIDEAAEEKKKEITDRTDVSDEEKEKAIEKVEEEREKGKEAVDNSTTEEEVEEAKDTAIDNINNIVVNPSKGNEAILMGGTAAISNKVQGKLTKYDTVRRVFGADRYGTAIAASKEMYKTGAKTVVIASGQQFSDELTATVYANIIDAPILLTEKGSIAQKTITEIERLGAKNIIIIGGDAVISNGVQSRLSKLGSVRRIVGADRYSTAVKIAKEIQKEVGTISEVALVNGTNFPDAISMTSYAVDRKIPILLTEPAKLNSNTEKLVNEWKVKDVKIGGGEVAVSKAAEKKLTAKGITVKRFMGADRYGTSVAVARALNLDAKNIVIASGENFADAVVGAPLAAHKGYPIVLVKQNAIPDSVNGYLNK